MSVSGLSTWTGSRRWIHSVHFVARYSTREGGSECVKLLKFASTPFAVKGKIGI